MTIRRPLVRGAVGAIGVLAAVATVSACTPPPPLPGPPPESFRLTALTHRNLDQNEFGLLNTHDEPYLMHVGFHVKFGVPGSTTTFRVHDYPNEICDSGDGIPDPDRGRDHPGPTSCSVPAAQGRVNLPPTRRLDVLDALLGTAPLELTGAVTVAMEADQLIPGGPPTQLTALEGALKDAFNATIAAGTLPQTETQLRDLLRQLIGDALRFVGGRALSILLGLGNGDDRIGLGATVLVGAKGTLAALLRPVLGPITIATGDSRQSVRAHMGVLEPQTFSLDYNADALVLENIGGGDTHYRYDYGVTAL